jgi:hypothetical protein
MTIENDHKNNMQPMKKYMFLVAVIGTVIFIYMNRNVLYAFFDTDNFYRPLYENDFDVLQDGTGVHADLKSSYDVEHGFFLLFPYESRDFDSVYEMDGLISYTISYQGAILESKIIAPPARPINGITSAGQDVLLFSFELPFQGHDEVELDVVVKSPITKLKRYEGAIRCVVKPAYWP